MADLERIVGENMYQTIHELADGRSIVMDVPTGILYFRKILSVYNLSVFQYLKKHPDPHVPAIRDFWQDGSRLVVIEELIQGRTLAEALEEGLSFSERKRILLDVCDGLTFLHSADPPIIHRDLKASNIMLTETGEVKIIDYDAAKTYTGKNGPDTVLIGTRGIAAPEQYGFGGSDARTDIYALGRLIERMLPESRTAARIAARATRMDPDQRYASAAAVKRHLELVREPTKNKRKTALRFVVPAAAAIAAAGCIFFAWRIGWSGQHAVPAAGEQPVVSASVSGTESALPEKAGASEYQSILAEFDADGSHEKTEDILKKVQALDRKYPDEDYLADFENYAIDKAEEREAIYQNGSGHSQAVIALRVYDALAGVSDEAAVCRQKLQERMMDDAGTLAEEKNYKAAVPILRALDDYDYPGAEALLNECLYGEADAAFQSGEFLTAKKRFGALDTYSDSADRAKGCQYQYARQLLDEGEYENAVAAFEEIPDYQDAGQQILTAKYEYCKSHVAAPGDTVYTYLADLEAAGYAGVSELEQQVYVWRADLSFEFSYSIGSMQGETVKAQLKGGGPDAATHVKFILRCAETGDVMQYTTPEAYHRGETATALLESNGGTTIIGKTFTVEAYDDAGNLMGTKTGVMEGLDF